MIKLRFIFHKEQLENLIKQDYKIWLYINSIIKNNILYTVSPADIKNLLLDLWYRIKNSQDKAQDLLDIVKYDFDIEKFRVCIEKFEDSNEYKSFWKKYNKFFYKDENNFIKIWIKTKNDNVITDIIEVVSPEYLYISYINRYNILNENEVCINNTTIFRVLDENLFRSNLISSFKKISILIENNNELILNERNIKDVLKILSNKILKSDLIGDIYYANPIWKK